MRKNHSKSIKIQMPRIAIALLLSVAMSLSLLWIGEKSSVIKPWLNLIVDVAPEWYMNTYYSSFSHHDNTIYDDVILLDLNERATRKDIASVLNLVAQHSPKVVGVDYTFPLSDNYDSAQTGYLINTINNIPQQVPLVFADDAESSAIPDSVMMKHHVGHVNFYGFYDFKSHDNNLSHMALSMADLAGFDTNKLDTATFVVNYNSLNLASVPVSKPLTKNDSVKIAKLVPNRHIIIGSTKDNSDMQKLPFKYNGKDHYIAGSRIIRSTLISILSTSAKKESPLKLPKYHAYNQLPLWLNWCVVILYAFIYLIIYNLLDNAMSLLEEKSKWWIILKGVIKSVVSVFSIGLLLCIAMIITNSFYLIPDVVVFLYMSVFMSYFYELLNAKPT